MKAAVLREVAKPLLIEDLELPSLSNGHILVQMQGAAVCHSQKLEVSGGRGPDRFLPHLIGHEGVGVVVDIGPGVTKVKSGDQVVLSWIRGSGQVGDPICYRSLKGRVNAGPIATFCEFPIVSEQCVTRLDPQVNPEIAVLAGCAIPTGAGTVWNGVPASVRGALCVFGAGGVGLAAVAGAVHAGWEQVVVVDLRQPRLQRARDLGATHTVHAGKEDVEEAVAKITRGRGFDLVIECAGAVSAMEMAVRVAKSNGGRVILIGNLEAGKKISIDPFDLIQGRWLGGSWGGGIDPDVDIPKIVRLVEQGALNHRLLSGRKFSLEQVNEAILALGDEDAGRPIIEFSCRAQA